MRKKRKSEDGGFNVWRSYSDMMAGVLLLFVLIMCVTLFQAQKSYNESIEERDEKIALQEEYTLEILAQQNELNEKEGQLKGSERTAENTGRKTEGSGNAAFGVGSQAEGSGGDTEHTESGPG
mgnify:CR=1 FL=1